VHTADAVRPTSHTVQCTLIRSFWLRKRNPHQHPLTNPCKPMRTHTNQPQTAEKRDAYVGQLVGLLGLAKVMESRVGNEKVRGLSGGERKRLAIGCELIRWG